MFIGAWWDVVTFSFSVFCFAASFYSLVNESGPSWRQLLGDNLNDRIDLVYDPWPFSSEAHRVGLWGGTSGVGCCFEIQLARKGLPVELMARSVFLFKLD